MADANEQIVTTPETLVGLYSLGAQSGKSTAAEWLCHQREYCRGRFAATLKNMVALILAQYGYPLNAVEAHLSGKLKEEPLDKLPGKPTARKMMQTLGTAWGRGIIHNDLWAEALRAPIVQMLGTQPVVIDDLRFPNEWALLKELGGVIIRIERVQKHSPTLEDLKEEVCEALLCEHEPDHIISAGSVEELHNGLEHLFPASGYELENVDG